MVKTSLLTMASDSSIRDKIRKWQNLGYTRDQIAEAISGSVDNIESAYALVDQHSVGRTNSKQLSGEDRNAVGDRLKKYHTDQSAYYERGRITKVAKELGISEEAARQLVIDTGYSDNDLKTLKRGKELQQKLEAERSKRNYKDKSFDARYVQLHDPDVKKVASSEGIVHTRLKRGMEHVAEFNEASKGMQEMMKRVPIGFFSDSRYSADQVGKGNIVTPNKNNKLATTSRVKELSKRDNLVGEKAASHAASIYAISKVINDAQKMRMPRGDNLWHISAQSMKNVLPGSRSSSGSGWSAISRSMSQIPQRRTNRNTSAWGGIGPMLGRISGRSKSSTSSFNVNINRYLPALRKASSSGYTSNAGPMLGRISKTPRLSSSRYDLLSTLGDSRKSSPYKPKQGILSRAKDYLKTNKNLIKESATVGAIGGLGFLGAYGLSNVLSMGVNAFAGAMSILPFESGGSIPRFANGKSTKDLINLYRVRESGSKRNNWYGSEDVVKDLIGKKYGVSTEELEVLKMKIKRSMADQYKVSNLPGDSLAAQRSMMPDREYYFPQELADSLSKPLSRNTVKRNWDIRMLEDGGFIPRFAGGSPNGISLDDREMKRLQAIFKDQDLIEVFHGGKLKDVNWATFNKNLASKYGDVSSAMISKDDLQHARKSLYDSSQTTLRLPGNIPFKSLGKSTGIPMMSSPLNRKAFNMSGLELTKHANGGFTGDLRHVDKTTSFMGALNRTNLTALDNASYRAQNSYSIAQAARNYAKVMGEQSWQISMKRLGAPDSVLNNYSKYVAEAFTQGDNGERYFATGGWVNKDLGLNAMHSLLKLKTMGSQARIDALRKQFGTGVLRGTGLSNDLQNEFKQRYNLKQYRNDPGMLYNKLFDPTHVGKFAKGGKSYKNPILVQRGEILTPRWNKSFEILNRAGRKSSIGGENVLPGELNGINGYSLGGLRKVSGFGESDNVLLDASKGIGGVLNHGATAWLSKRASIPAFASGNGINYVNSSIGSMNEVLSQGKLANWMVGKIGPEKMSFGGKGAHENAVIIAKAIDKQLKWNSKNAPLTLERLSKMDLGGKGIEEILRKREPGFMSNPHEFLKFMTSDLRNAVHGEKFARDPTRLPDFRGLNLGQSQIPKIIQQTSKKLDQAFGPMLQTSKELKDLNRAIHRAHKNLNQVINDPSFGGVISPRGGLNTNYDPSLLGGSGTVKLNQKTPLSPYQQNAQQRMNPFAQFNMQMARRLNISNLAPIFNDPTFGGKISSRVPSEIGKQLQALMRNPAFRSNKNIYEALNYNPENLKRSAHNLGEGFVSNNPYMKEGSLGEVIGIKRTPVDFSFIKKYKELQNLVKDPFKFLTSDLDQVMDKLETTSLAGVTNKNQASQIKAELDNIRNKLKDIQENSLRELEETSKGLNEYQTAMVVDQQDAAKRMKLTKQYKDNPRFNTKTVLIPSDDGQKTEDSYRFDFTQFDMNAYEQAMSKIRGKKWLNRIKSGLSNFSTGFLGGGYDRQVSLTGTGVKTTGLENYRFRNDDAEGRIKEIGQISQNLYGGYEKQLKKFIVDELGRSDLADLVHVKTGTPRATSLTDKHGVDYTEFTTDFTISVELLSSKLKDLGMTTEQVEIFLDKFGKHARKVTDSDISFTKGEAQVAQPHRFSGSKTAQASKLLQGLSWGAASFSMASMGVYFSLMSTFTTLDSLLRSMTSSLSDLQNVFKNKAYVDAFGSSLLKSSTIMHKFGITQKDLISGYKNLTSVQSTFGLALSSISASIFKDSEYTDALSQAMVDLLTSVQDSGALESFKSMILSFAKSLPEVINGLKPLIDIFKWFADNPMFTSMAIKLAAVTLILQPLTSGFSALFNIADKGFMLINVIRGISAGLVTMNMGLAATTATWLLGFGSILLVLEAVGQAVQFLTGMKAPAWLTPITSTLKLVNNLSSGSNPTEGIGEMWFSEQPKIGFANGGTVPTPTRDMVPGSPDDTIATLQSGEVVLNRNQVKNLKHFDKGTGIVTDQSNRGDQLYYGNKTVQNLADINSTNLNTNKMWQSTYEGDGFGVYVRNWQVGWGNQGSDNDWIKSLFENISFPYRLNYNPINVPTQPYTPTVTPTPTSTPTPTPTFSTVPGVAPTQTPTSTVTPTTTPTTSPTTFDSIIDVISEAIKNITPKITDAFNTFIDTIQNAVESVNKGIINAFDTIITTAGNISTSIGDVVLNISNMDIKGATTWNTQPITMAPGSVGKGGSVNDLLYQHGYYSKYGQKYDYSPVNTNNGMFSRYKDLDFFKYGRRYEKPAELPKNQRGSGKTGKNLVDLWPPSQGTFLDKFYDYGEIFNTMIQTEDPLAAMTAIGSSKGSNEFVKAIGSLTQRGSLALTSSGNIGKQLVGKGLGVFGAGFTKANQLSGNPLIYTGAALAEASGAKNEFMTGNKTLQQMKMSYYNPVTSLVTGGWVGSGGAKGYQDMAKYRGIPESVMEEQLRSSARVSDIGFNIPKYAAKYFEFGMSGKSYDESKNFGANIGSNAGINTDNQLFRTGFNVVKNNMLPGAGMLFDQIFNPNQGADFEKRQKSLIGTGLDIPLIGLKTGDIQAGAEYGINETTKSVANMDIGSLAWLGSSIEGLSKSILQTSYNTGKMVGENPMSIPYMAMKAGLPGLPAPLLGTALNALNISDLIMPGTAKYMEDKGYGGQNLVGFQLSDILGGDKATEVPQTMDQLNKAFVETQSKSFDLNKAFTDAALSSDNASLMYDSQTKTLMSLGEASQLSSDNMANLVPATMDLNTGMVTLYDGTDTAVTAMQNLSDVVNGAAEVISQNQNNEVIKTNVTNAAETFTNPDQVTGQLNQYGTAWVSKAEQESYIPATEPTSISFMNSQLEQLNQKIETPQTQPQDTNLNVTIKIDVTGSDKNEIANEVTKKLESNLGDFIRGLVKKSTGGLFG